jgi:hypothetical protein
MRSYLVALYQIMQRHRAMLRDLLADQRRRVARLRAAESGPKRREILKESYLAESIHTQDLIELSSALGELRPPATLSTPHEHLLHALDEMVAANRDKATAHNSNDKQALSKARQREAHATDLWRVATNELRRLTKDRRE